VAWLKLGDAELTAGDHRLQIRLAKRKDDQGRWQRVLYASDAVCLSQGPFQPNSKFKPNETGRDSADEAAAKVVFPLPEAKYSVRSSVKLAGIWEVARDDEQLPGAVDAPLQDLPTKPVWRAIPVPSDKNKTREDLIFAHRLWYRARICDVGWRDCLSGQGR
jgi:beta-galactosidase